MRKTGCRFAIAMLVQAPVATAPAEATPFATSAAGLGGSEPSSSELRTGRRRAGGRFPRRRRARGGVHGGGVRAGGVTAAGALGRGRRRRRQARRRSRVAGWSRPGTRLGGPAARSPRARRSVPSPRRPLRPRPAPRRVQTYAGTIRNRVRTNGFPDVSQEPADAKIEPSCQPTQRSRRRRNCCA